MIRIVSGNHRGRKIAAPKNLPVRPTTDRAKEALFNILMHRLDLEQTRVLDLYSGTGNLSYEFASRGCPDITAVDAHAGCAAFIRKTAEELGMPIRVFRQKAISYLERDRSAYDLIVADPPYAISREDLQALLERCMDDGRLTTEGLCILEHSPDHDLSAEKGFQEARRYGRTVFSLFSHIPK